MHAASFFSTITLFFFAASSGAKSIHKVEARSLHQIVARSVDLSLRQTTDDAHRQACGEVCAFVKDKLLRECGLSKSCVCGPGLSVPFHECAQCTYDYVPESLKQEAYDKYYQWVDACAEVGYPVQGDTTIITDAPTSNTQPSSSSSSLASTSAPVRSISSTTSVSRSTTSSTTPSASAADLSSLSSTTSEEPNGAVGLSHRSLLGVGLGAAGITTFVSLLV